MNPFVSVLCVLCVSVVKKPLSVAVLHRTRTIAARMSTTSWLNHARYSLDVGHSCGAFSAHHASPISVGVCPRMTCLFSMSSNVIIFIVNLHPLPSPTPPEQLECGEMWGS
jgi:hypothetical protein